MSRLTRLGLIVAVFVLMFAMICRVRAQAEGEILSPFLDSEIPGIRIQVNATAEAKPTGNLTLWLRLVPQTSVQVELLNLTVYGFLNGTTKISIGNISDSDFPLTGSPKEYEPSPFPVPAGVWGVTFGEIVLTYSANLGGLGLTFPNATTGFYMTNVENTFLENLESQFAGLNESFGELNDTFNKLSAAYSQLNQSYTQLDRNYTALQGNINELDNTRRVAVILGITTVFFVATTFFMVIRRPRENW